MSHPEVSYADAVATIGILPSLAPRPCATNLRALTIDLVDTLSMVPSEQSADLGYSGMVEQDAVHSLRNPTPWVNFLNPGQVPESEIGWTREEIADNIILRAALKGCFNSESNMRRATNAAINKATP